MEGYLMDKAAEQLKRIADILETILKLVKDDMEASKKRWEKVC